MSPEYNLPACCYISLLLPHPLTQCSMLNRAAKLLIICCVSPLSISDTLYLADTLCLLYWTHQRALSCFKGLTEKMSLADNVHGVFKGTGLAFALDSRSVSPSMMFRYFVDGPRRPWLALSMYVNKTSPFRPPDFARMTTVALMVTHVFQRCIQELLLTRLCSYCIAL
jgi:hypothetical protein